MYSQIHQQSGGRTNIHFRFSQTSGRGLVYTSPYIDCSIHKWNVSITLCTTARGIYHGIFGNSSVNLNGSLFVCYRLFAFINAFKWVICGKTSLVPPLSIGCFKMLGWRHTFHAKRIPNFSDLILLKRFNFRTNVYES